ncbi:hypothetical protein EXIGUO9Y_110077 [Exiguobacterium oxidotolerans]|uniref:Uncharacterized protein n=1 Tax=Exiguobacterium oxidotolerans TaxID=223958 RepID=A0A653I3D0_9BACL|nr:hypothetical protein EXIGUO9Y_110077 [Exiguobacterium oxidotolerans]
MGIYRVTLLGEASPGGIYLDVPY